MELRSQILLHTKYILSEEIAENCDWCKYEIDSVTFPADILWNVLMISDRKNNRTLKSDISSSGNIDQHSSELSGSLSNQE